MVTKDSQSRVAALVHYSAALLAWLGIWGVAVRLDLFGNSLLPGPCEVMRGMMSPRVVQVYVRQGLGQTFFWSTLAWAGGIFLTILLGHLLRDRTGPRRVVELALAAGRSLPSVIAVPLFAAAFGFGRVSASFCAMFLVVCYSAPVYVERVGSNLAEKEKLVECLGLNSMQRFLLIGLPGAGAALEAIAVQSFGIALVVTVAAEMILSFSNSVGNWVAELTWLLRMVEVYALVGYLVVGTLTVNLFASLLPRMLRLPARALLGKIDD